MVERKGMFKGKRIYIHAFFILFALLCLIPFLLVLSISVSNEADLLEYGYKLLPMNLDFFAYEYIFNMPMQIINSYIVTIIVTTAGTFFGLLLMAMIAYPLSRPNFRFRKAVSFYIFFTMLFSGGLVPYYILISHYLNWTDTYWALIIPGLVSSWFIIMLRTFFQDIPSELNESAKIDGASEFTILFRIILPLSKPALATVAFMGAVGRWNDWFSALLFINKESIMPLQYLLYRIMSNVQFLEMMKDLAPPGLLDNIKTPKESMRMAMCVLAAGPMLIVFPFFQKYFVKGLTVGSVKG